MPQIDKEQAELAHANFSTLRKEAQSILDLVICYSYCSFTCITNQHTVFYVLMSNIMLFLIRAAF